MAAFGDKMTEIESILVALDELDVLCEIRNIRAEILLLGGAALLLHMQQADRKFRPTRDIDINILSSTDAKGFMDILSELAIDIVGGIMEVPPAEDFKERDRFRLEGTRFTHIDVYVPSIELLACSKIFSRREKDLKDLEETDLLELCDLDSLFELVEEYKDFLLNPNDPNSNHHQLKEILKRKGININ
nr:DUF6036 family nucleotidyltransferase [Chryseomicrobium aureum]